MRVNWNGVEPAEDFGPAPAGTYLCEVSEADTATTKYDDEMWKLSMKIVDGRYTGKRIWDNVVFSEAAMSRAKLICGAFGLETEGEVDIYAHDLVQRRAYVTVTVEDYTNNNGESREKNSVTYGGYTSAASDAVPVAAGESEATVDDDIPF